MCHFTIPIEKYGAVPKDVMPETNHSSKSMAMNYILTHKLREFASILRKKSARVILVANKAEGNAGEVGFFDAFSLGLGEPVRLSGEHGEGMIDLQHVLMPIAKEFDEDKDILVINKPKGMVVHPGAGNNKDTLVNALLFKYKKNL